MCSAVSVHGAVLESFPRKVRRHGPAARGPGDMVLPGMRKRSSALLPLRKIQLGLRRHQLPEVQFGSLRPVLPLSVRLESPSCLMHSKLSL